MIKKIKTYLLVALMGFTLGVPALVPIAASAACSTIANNISTGANGAAGAAGVVPVSDCDAAGGVNDSSVAKLAQKVVSTFSIIVGVVAVIMIIYGGFRYITSGGDSGRVGNAKNSLIYAIVGLVIVALAQLIVHFVLNQTGSIAQ